MFIVRVEIHFTAGIHIFSDNHFAFSKFFVKNLYQQHQFLILLLLSTSTTKGLEYLSAHPESDMKVLSL